MVLTSGPEEGNMDALWRNQNKHRQILVKNIPHLKRQYIRKRLRPHQLEQARITHEVSTHDLQNMVCEVLK